MYHNPNRPSGFTSICRRCAYNVRLRAQATSLLQYYAARSDGFAPALATIERETGIKANKIAEIRQRLIDRGLILYRPQTFVIVNWPRIQTFAMLTDRLPVVDADSTQTTAQKRAHTQRLYCVSPQERDPLTRRRTTIADQIKRSKTPCDLTPTQKELFGKVAKMTPEEYREWLSFDMEQGEYIPRQIEYIQQESEQHRQERLMEVSRVIDRQQATDEIDQSA